MKKIIALLLFLGLLLPVLSCAMAERVDLSGYTIEQLYSLKNKVEREIQSRIASSKNLSSGYTEYIDLGSISAALNGYELRQENWKNYLIVNVNWINQSDEPGVFYTEAVLEAYQNGVELDTGYIYSIETNVSKKVLPGYSGAIKEIYQLQNAKDEVVLILHALFDFSKSRPTTQITIKAK